MKPTFVAIDLVMFAACGYVAILGAALIARSPSNVVAWLVVAACGLRCWDCGAAALATWRRG